jgi:hypothetical protein
MSSDHLPLTSLRHEWNIAAFSFRSSILLKKTAEEYFKERNLYVLQNSSSIEECIVANKLMSLIFI